MNPRLVGTRGEPDARERARPVRRAGRGDGSSQRRHRAPARPYTHAWLNGFGKLRRCTERCRPVVDFYLFLAAAIVVLRRLLQQARRRYRWPGRPTTRRLK